MSESGTGAAAAIGDLASPTPARRPSGTNYDVLRGILILVVMLDHNDIIRNVRSVDTWFLPMTFHVAGFLLLPFLSPPKMLTGPMARDHTVRYLVPFFFALLLYSLAYQILIARLSLARWIGSFSTALFFADTASLHDSTGFIVLWFLPALLSSVLLLAAYNISGAFWRSSILIVAIVVHCTVGAAGSALKAAIPQGLLIALYIFPLGIFIRWAMPWILAPRRLISHAAFAAILLLAAWAFERGTEVEVATLVVPTLNQPLLFIATDASNLCFLVVLVAVSPLLARISAIATLGRYSLLVYLTHPLLYKPILALLLHFCTANRLGSPSGQLLYWTGAAASVILVASMSLAAAAISQAIPWFRALVTPKDFYGWLPIAVLSPRPHR